MSEGKTLLPLETRDTNLRNTYGAPDIGGRITRRYPHNVLRKLVLIIATFWTISACIQADPPVVVQQDSDIYVVNCVTFEQKPVELVLYCADAGQILTDIKWSIWTGTEAIGYGTSTTNDCEPNCAAGTDVVTNVDIKLIKPVTSAEGRQVFSQIEMQYENPQPSGVMDEILDLPTDILR